MFYSTHHFINEKPECQRLNNYPRASQRPHTAAHRPDLETDIFGSAYNAFDLIFVTCQYFNTGTFSSTTDLLYQIHFKITETGEAAWRSLYLPGPSVPHFSASAPSSPTVLAKEKWLLTEHNAIYMVFLVVFYCVMLLSAEHLHPPLDAAQALVPHPVGFPDRFPTCEEVSLDQPQRCWGKYNKFLCHISVLAAGCP